ncbi:beta-class carbonic anhydrase [Halalkalibacterium ligniniphilum]|uniref:beta-class carbonic anhydrase n=1 Tax=Halalkalibacterium ligniniphilum TaxID=1134413 RepID=UPI00034D7862
MSLLNSILEHNQAFVEAKTFEQYRTEKFPKKKLVILTCMDTRLNELLPHAMNLKNGDAKIIRNAGAVISHPFGSIMRSILVALYELQAKEVCIIGHHGCGMTGLEGSSILKKIEERGVDSTVFQTLEASGINVKNFLTGFTRVEDNVMNSVEIVRNHPLLPPNIPVHGLVIHPETGKLDLVSSGYNQE